MTLLRRATIDVIAASVPLQNSWGQQFHNDAAERLRTAVPQRRCRTAGDSSSTMALLVEWQDEVADLGWDAKGLPDIFGDPAKRFGDPFSGPGSAIDFAD